jgi:pimeloyl-ACP methyl ester carboxylesterase
VLAVDRPGQGLADPFDYRGVDLLDHARTFLSDILDALELPTVEVAANSLGALWSVAFAIEAPNRVSRLALVGAPAGLKQRPPLQLILLGLPLIGQRLGRHVFSSATRDGSRKFWGQVLVKHPERVDDLLLDVDVAHARRNVESMLGLMQCIADARRRGLRRELILGERWAALTTPTLLVWGDGDAFGSLEEAESLVTKNPNLRLIRIAWAPPVARRPREGRRRGRAFPDHTATDASGGSGGVTTASDVARSRGERDTMTSCDVDYARTRARSLLRDLLSGAKGRPNPRSRAPSDPASG